MESPDLLRINSILVERKSEGRVECCRGGESSFPWGDVGPEQRSERN